MLNMDARCLIIPNLDGLATQISDAEASLKSQKDIKDVTVEDILIGIKFYKNLKFKS